ncbi:MAG: glycosyltransferase [Candidatus Woesearchaeota archaeon]
MLSIIISACNEEKSIIDLLDSILYQSYRNYEIIIIDSGSTDDTVKVAKDFIEKSQDKMSKEMPILFKIIKSKERNISQQKNIGVKLSSGNILLFIDADMKIPSEHFLYYFMKKLSKSNYIGAICRVKIGRGLKNRIASNIIDFFVFMQNFFMINTVRAGIHFIKKEYYNKIRGFNEKLFVVEDIDLYRRLNKHGSIYHEKKFFVLESDRRYKKDGYVKTIATWTINSIWSFFFKEPFFTMSGNQSDDIFL